MKKMFTLLMSLMVFSALFAQYDKPYNDGYNNHNAPYNGGNYNNNNGNYIPQQSADMRHDDGNFQSFNRRDDYNRHEEYGDRMDGYHHDREFGYRHDRDFGYHDRDGWRRDHHRGFGLLGTGLVVGGVIGVMIAAHH